MFQCPRAPRSILEDFCRVQESHIPFLYFKKFASLNTMSGHSQHKTLPSHTPILSILLSGAAPFVTLLLSKSLQIRHIYTYGEIKPVHIGKHIFRTDLHIFCFFINKKTQHVNDGSLHLLLRGSGVHMVNSFNAEIMWLFYPSLFDIVN